MKRLAYRPGTITRISVGVAALVVMLLMALDFAFGLVPDPLAQALDRRQMASELLAERLTQIASQKGPSELQAALHAARLQDRQLRTIGLRRADQALMAASGDHRGLWPSQGLPDGRPLRDGSALQIPLRAQDAIWGRLELVYVPLAGGRGLGALLHLHTLWPALSFGLITLLLRLYLGRVLKQLDPAAVVPERVRTAYNSLAEAVVMVDAQGRVVLTNHAFQELIAPRRIQLGHRLEEQRWVHSDLVFDALDSLPWRTALRTGKPSQGHRMALTDSRNAGETATTSVTPVARVAQVGCTPILDDRERVQGCLIVFQDQTAIERANDELQHTLSELRLANAQISEQHQEMMRLATLDPLTSCMNRRAFFEAARGQMQRCVFDGAAVAVLMVDIDHFKQFNDRYGHAIGDDVIRAVANLLQTQSRPEDLVCRYGGEEFCLLLPECDEALGLVVAERLRAAIAADAGRHIRELALSITASVGLAVAREDRVSLEALIEEADQALYASKRSGRNRVTLAGAEASDTAPTIETNPPTTQTAPA